MYGCLVAICWSAKNSFVHQELYLASCNSRVQCRAREQTDNWSKEEHSLKNIYQWDITKGALWLVAWLPTGAPRVREATAMRGCTNALKCLRLRCSDRNRRLPISGPWAHFLEFGVVSRVSKHSAPPRTPSARADMIGPLVYWYTQYRKRLYHSKKKELLSIL